MYHPLLFGCEGRIAARVRGPDCTFNVMCIGALEFPARSVAVPVKDSAAPGAVIDIGCGQEATPESESKQLKVMEPEAPGGSVTIPCASGAGVIV